MHDSEQEHSGITGCRVTYESTIFYNEANKFSIIVVKTNDPRIPLQACSDRYYGDRMLRFTAVGYELPRTKAVELELDGEWVESKYGYQLQVEQWQEIVPQTADGLLAYLGSGLIKGIGPKTAEDIVATFGPDTLNILDNEPEKLLQIRGITEGKLKDIEESYAESRVLRNLMSLLGPFKITPATALKIYQHFGPACVDILKKCPYDLCQISGFGFKRVDGIVRKTDNRLHSTERIKGAVLYTLEDARSKSGHLFLPSEDLVKETLLLLNAPIPIPEQRVRTEEVQETLQQMILHGAVVAYKQYLYSPRVFGQEDDTARMIAERLANISVAENIESALESVRESLGITLSQKQEQAVRTAFQHGLTIITGSPGTGKTTVLKAIIEVFKNLHPKGKFALMAPTGRASRRMAESTGVDEARTLHSALGLGTGEEVGDGERVRFVDADLVIVDEFSMVDMWLAQQFFKRIGQHTRVVLVGDPNQLPSVGAGNVFYELIHSGMVPVTVLDWIFRQSKDGLIAYNAKFINEGSTKLYYGNALYGRFAVTIKLNELNYLEAAKFYPDKTPYDKVAHYAVFGGSPFVNQALRPTATLRENIVSTILNPVSAVYLYASQLLLSDYSVKINAERIFAVIGNGKKRYSEIEDKLDVKKTGNLAKQMKPLRDLEIISRNYPINKLNDSKKSTFEINDNLLRFYFTFIYKNASALQVLGAEAFYDEYVAPTLADLRAFAVTISVYRFVLGN